MKDAVKWAKIGFDSITYSLDATVFIQAYQTLTEQFHKAVNGVNTSNP